VSDSIDRLLEKFDPKKDAALGAALGLTQTETQVYWAALSAVGEDLAIPNLTKLAGKIVKFPSPYINTLRKKKMIVKGDGKGKWSVSPQALKKIEAILKDGLPELPEKGGATPTKKVVKTAKKTKRAKKKGGKRKLGPKRAPGTRMKKFARMSVAALFAKLEAEESAIGEEIADLEARRDAVRLKIAAIKDALK
jgi:hypothetical protein